MEGLGQFADLRGARQEKGGDIFERQADTPMHTMSSNVNHCICVISFWLRADWEGLDLYA